MGITIAAATGIDVGTSSCNHRRTGHGVGTFRIGLGMEKMSGDSVVFEEDVKGKEATVGRMNDAYRKSDLANTTERQRAVILDATDTLLLL